MRKEVLIAAIFVVALGYASWAFMSGKPDNTAKDPKNTEATAPVPDRASQGGPSDPQPRETR